MSLPNNSALDSRPHSEREPILCYVTDRLSLRATLQESAHEALLKKIEELSAGGVSWIQLREKDMGGKDFAKLAREALSRISGEPHSPPTGTRAETRVILNDRVDVALTENAGGVHLGENSLPAEQARRMLLAFRAGHAIRQDFLIGVSCHSLEAAQTAASSGADYIFFGPVFATPSKVAYGPSQGMERLAEVCKSVTIPVLAIGGITLANASECLSAGASGIAAIRLFQDPDDGVQIVRRLRRQVQ